MRTRTHTVLWILVVLVVVAGIALHLSRDRILRTMTVNLVEEITGFGVELADIEVHLFKRTLELTDLKLINPEPFVREDAIHLSRVFAELSGDAMLGRRSWLTRLELEIASLNLIRPREGVSNLERLGENAAAWEESRLPAEEARLALQPVLAGWGGMRARQAGPLEIPSEEPDLQIDVLRIWIGEIHVVDHKLGRFEPVRFSSTLDREMTYQDVTDLDQLGENLAIDFGVDALLGQFSELEEAFPGLASGFKDLLKQARTPGTPEAEALDDAVDLFKDALDGLSK